MKIWMNINIQFHLIFNKKSRPSRKLENWLTPFLISLTLYFLNKNADKRDGIFFLHDIFRNMKQKYIFFPWFLFYKIPKCFFGIVKLISSLIYSNTMIDWAMIKVTQRRTIASIYIDSYRATGHDITTYDNKFYLLHVHLIDDHVELRSRHNWLYKSISIH